MNPAEVTVAVLAGLAWGSLCLLSVHWLFRQSVDAGSLDATWAAAVTMGVAALLLAAGSIAGVWLLSPILQGAAGLTYFLLAELGLFVPGLLLYLIGRLLLLRGES